MSDPILLPEADPETDRLLALLGELGEIGLDVARAIGRRANEAGPEEDLNALSMAYSRVSRAVRLTVMLQSKLMQERKALRASAAELAARLEPAYVHKMRVERIVERLAKREHQGDEDQIDRLVIEAGEHLDDPDRLEDIEGRPIGELLAIICRDLRLEPDWAKLAQEPWAKAEIASGMLNSPFTRPPPFTGEVPQRGGGGTPQSPTLEPCEPRPSPTSAPDG
jgi:hypothetical protein